MPLDGLWSFVTQGKARQKKKNLYTHFNHNINFQYKAGKCHSALLLLQITTKYMVQSTVPNLMKDSFSFFIIPSKGPRGHSWNSSLIPPHKERQCRLHCKPSQTSFKVPLIIRLRAQSVGLHSSLSPALSDLHQRCQGRCQTGCHVIFDKADFSEHTPTRMKSSQWRSDWNTAH